MKKIIDGNIERWEECRTKATGGMDGRKDGYAAGWRTKKMDFEGL